MIKVIGDATEGTPLDTDTGTRTNGKMAERLVGGGGLSPRWKISRQLFPPLRPLVSRASNSENPKIRHSQLEQVRRGVRGKIFSVKVRRIEETESLKEGDRERERRVCIHVRVRGVQLVTEHFQNYKRTSGANKILENEIR